MLSQEALEKLTERIVKRIEELNTYMIDKLGTQLYDIGNLMPSQVYEIFQSIKYGNDLTEIMNKLAEVTDMNIKDIYDMFEEIAKKDQRWAKMFYEYRNIPFIPYEQNNALKSLVKTIGDVAVNDYLNISNTFAFCVPGIDGKPQYTKFSEIYQQITDRGIIAIQTGRETYGSYIKEIMRDISSKGMQTIDYASGYHRRADSSIRLNIMEGIRTLNNKVEEYLGQEFGADGIEIIHHKNPAEDHSTDDLDHGSYDIDGKQFTIEEFNEINSLLHRPVSTLNCYHTKRFIILGTDEPLYDENTLKADKKANLKGFEYEGKHYTNYDGTQLQRRIETKIRQYKDRMAGSTAVHDMEDVLLCKKKIKQLTNKYHNLCEVSGLEPRYQRLRTY